MTLTSDKYLVLAVAGTLSLLIVTINDYWLVYACDGGVCHLKLSPGMYGDNPK